MWKRLCLLTLLTLNLLIPACKTEPQNLQFETVEQADTLQDAEHNYAYEDRKPTILIIAQPAEIANPGLGITLDEATVDHLLQVDYDQSFAILVLRGREPSTGFEVTIQYITRQDEYVKVNAHFSEPEKDMEMLLVETSPYHLVSVVKEGQWGQNFNFILQRNSQKIDKTTHFIP